MNENGLSDVMNLIKRQQWERLFRRTELMHTAACKEFYANLTMYHYKKKEVARSRVRGVKIELDNMTLASILGVPGNTGISEYIKEVWEESKYIKPLEITRKFVNDELLTATRRGEEPKRYDFLEETFLTMCQLKRENGVWWIGTGEHRRRDDEIDAPAANEEVNEEEEAQHDFDWEAVHEEAEIQGGSGLAKKCYDAEDEVQGSEDVIEEVPDVPAQASAQQKETTTAGVDPSAPTDSIPDSVFMSLQAEFEHARADRIQADLARAQAENARLLALLQQAQTPHKTIGSIPPCTSFS
ncbi:hypothetical protein Dimus_018090 [Dionaea muscipula]